MVSAKFAPVSLGVGLLNQAAFQFLSEVGRTTRDKLNAALWIHEVGEMFCADQFAVCHENSGLRYTLLDSTDIIDRLPILVNIRCVSIHDFAGQHDAVFVDDLADHHLITLRPAILVVTTVDLENFAPFRLA